MLAAGRRGRGRRPGGRSAGCHHAPGPHHARPVAARNLQALDQLRAGRAAGAGAGWATVAAGARGGVRPWEGRRSRAEAAPPARARPRSRPLPLRPCRRRHSPASLSTSAGGPGERAGARRPSAAAGARRLAPAGCAAAGRRPRRTPAQGPQPRAAHPPSRLASMFLSVSSCCALSAMLPGALWRALHRSGAASAPKRRGLYARGRVERAAPWPPPSARGAGALARRAGGLGRWGRGRGSRTAALRPQRGGDARAAPALARGAPAARPPGCPPRRRPPAGSAGAARSPPAPACPGPSAGPCLRRPAGERPGPGKGVGG
jgi:hypothetical protein